MNQLIQGLTLLKALGAIQITSHGTKLYVTFKSHGDASAFLQSTKGATLDSDLTVCVDMVKFFR